MSVEPVAADDVPPGPRTRSERTADSRLLILDAAVECLVSAGYAGASTLAVLLHPAWDMGVICRPGSDCPQVRTGGRPLVLVARNTAAGSARATAAVNALAGQGVRVAVLAVVSDGLPDPVPAAYRFRLLTPRVGAMARIPFVPLLRAADDPALVVLPRKVRRALAEIRAEALGMAGWAFPGTL